MKKPQKVLLIVLAVLICTVMLSACTRHDTVADAKDYVAEKYGDGYRVVHTSHPIQEVRRWFPHSSSDLCISFSGNSEKFTVWYDSERGEFYDDLQADEICAQISNVILAELSPKLGEYIPYEELCEFGSVNELMLSMEGSYFHERYDGDIYAFCEKEKPSLHLKEFGKIVLLSDGDDWEDRLTAARDCFERYFSPTPYYFGNRNYYDIRCYVVDKSAYEELAYIPSSLFGWEGLIAALTIDIENGTSIYTPRWIEVLDGLYFTATEENCDIVFADGDLRFVEALSASELQELHKKNHSFSNPDGSEDVYLTAPSSPVYELTASDELLARYGKSSIIVYIKAGDESQRPLCSSFNPEENDSHIHPLLYASSNTSQSVSLNGSGQYEFYYWYGTYETKEITNGKS